MIKDLRDFVTAKTEAVLTSRIGLWNILGYVCLLVWSTPLWAQGSVASDYTCVQSTAAAYTNMVGGTSIPFTTLGLSPTASFGGGSSFNAPNIPIGFNFVFNNASYSTVNISDNGYISFGANTAAVTNPIGNTTAYNGAIAGFGCNLAGNIALGTSTGYSADGADIKYLTTGTSPNQVFTVEYKNLKRRNTITNTDGFVNFQIRLYEADMKIEIVYRNFSSAVATSTLVQVGLRGLTVGDFNNRRPGAGVNPWVPTALGTAAADNISTTNANGPNAGAGFDTVLTWTPNCFNPTNLVTNLQVDNTTVNFSWTAPAFATASFTGYNWEVRTANAPGSGPAGLYASGTTALTSASVTGLTAGTPYYFYVKSNCKPWTNIQSAAGATSAGTTITVGSTTGLTGAMYALVTAGTGAFATATTVSTITNATQLVVSTAPTTALSGGATVITFSYFPSATLTPQCTTPVFPYLEDFEGVAVPDIPNCTTVVNTTGAAMVTRNNTVTPYYGFNNKNLITGSAAAADTWWFTRRISLTSGNTYRVSYKYGGSRELAQFNQKMKVMIGIPSGANPVPADMTLTLADHPNIKSSPNTFTFNFVAPGTGNYVMGFNGYASFNQGYLQIDDVSLTNPTCFPPTALTTASITYNSAIVSWTAPTPAPSAGYEYYLSTSATAPIATTSISGVNSGTVTTLTGLTPSTTYYMWVRSNCGGEFSIWSTVVSFTTIAAPPTPCTPAPSSVDGQGITNVTVGSINNTTGAEAGNFGNYTNLSTNIAQTQTVTVSITYRTGFTYNTRIWIDWNNDGVFDNNSGSQEIVYTGVSTSANPTTLLASFVVPSSVTGVANTAGPHRMRIGGADIDLLNGTAAGQGPCYNGTYGAFEDYTVFVTSPPPALTLSSSSDAYCSGGTSSLVTLTAGAGSYDNFSWNPSVGVSGSAASGWTFNPTTAGVITYTLTATQASGLFLSNTATFTVTVYDVPSPIVFSPSTISVCEGVPTALTSSGGIISGALIFEENFNGATNSFTAVNNSTGGSSPANAAWTLRNSPYLYSSTSFVSNDSSQFYMSNSDSQGSGSSSTTNTELTSPLISFVGYTNVSLSYWQYYRGYSAGSADTQVWNDVNGNGLVDGAETITTVQTFSTVTQGGASNFVNQIVDLSGFAGQTNIRIKFKYNNATWAWYWALDNVKITGSGPAALSWSPTTGLWLDAAATNPYTGGPATTVYAKLSNNQVYTATAASLAPPFCSTSNTLTVNVTKAGTAAGDQSLTCGNTTLASNITLTGYVPAVPATITGWQMADNPSFTGATTIAGSAGKDVLTPADVTGLSGTTYIRAMINGCPTLFSNAVVVSYPTVTWNGAWNPGPPSASDNVTIASGTLTLTSDLTVCNLRVSTGATLNVNPGVTLTVNGAVVISTFGAGGNLNLLDDNTFVLGNGSLMQNPAATTNTNTGKATFKRTIWTRKFDYTYWSSPLNPMTLINVSPTTLSDKFLRFDSNLYQWTFPNPALTTMTPGVGYAIRGPQAYSTTALTLYQATFTGAPNNGDYNVTLYRPSPTNDLNFVGNPYPSAISADAIMDGNVGPLGAAGVGTTFYFWTHNTLFNGSSYVNSDYAAYNRTGGVGTQPGTPTAGGNNQTPNGIISAGQGFMVKAVTPGTLTFKNTMRVAGANLQFFRSASANKSRVWLNFVHANNPEQAKQLLVGYLPNATNDYEDGFDGEVIEAGSSMGFYSKAQGDDKKLMIQGRALPFDQNDRVLLGFRADAAATYKIELDKQDGLFADASVGIYLEDTFLNVIHDLRQGAYSFVSDAGTFDTRFVLRYNNSLLGVNPAAWNQNSVVVFKQNDQIHIETSLKKMKSVKIFDLQGRLVMQKDNINSQSVAMQKVGLANQVLMVEVTSVDGEVTNKKTIY